MKRLDTYSVGLHLILVAMAGLIVHLALENRQLKQPPEVPALEIGDSVEPVAVRHLDGREETFDVGDGKERLVLVFTTTCPACRDNQTAWSALHERLGDTMDIVGVSLDDAERTLAYRDEHALPFPIVVAENRDDFVLTYELSAVPLTLHIGADGTVAGTWLGGLTDDLVAQVGANASPAS